MLDRPLAVPGRSAGPYARNSQQSVRLPFAMADPWPDVIVR